MQKKISIWLFVSMVILLPLTVFGIVNWYEANFQQLPVLYGKEHKLSDFKMVNQKGYEVTMANWKGKIIVTNFFFTHCPVICPKMTKNLKTVQQYFFNDKNILFNSFSVDPERDSVKQLSRYAYQFDIKGNWNLLTGDKKEIYRLARKNFFVVATDGDGGPNDFIHSDKIVLIDQADRIRGYYDGSSTAAMEQLIKDINKLKQE